MELSLESNSAAFVHIAWSVTIGMEVIPESSALTDRVAKLVADATFFSDPIHSEDALSFALSNAHTIARRWSDVIRNHDCAFTP